MNVYDFDKTIYDGDSIVDFYKFCLKRNPLLLRYIFRQGMGFAFFTVGIYDKTKFKEQFYSFLQGIDDTGKYPDDFWNSHINRMKPWYIRRMKPDAMVDEFYSDSDSDAPLGKIARDFHIVKGDKVC